MDSNSFMTHRLSPFFLSSSNHAVCLSLLQSCTSISDFLQIHAQVIRNHLFQHPFASASLLEFLTTFHHGSLHYARKVFDQISHPNSFSYNTLIRAFASSPDPAPSLHLFRRMLSSSGPARPNSYTYPFLLKACARLSALRRGEQLHCLMLKSAADRDVYAVNGLISIYAACGRIELGRQVFDTSEGTDVVSWNSMLSGYVDCGLLECARGLFDDMPERGIVSWNAVINGYAKSGDIGAARELFDRMPDRNVESWNTLIAGYARCGLLDISRKLFDEMPARNVVSWSVMVTAYAQGDRPSEALVLFERMKDVGVSPNFAAIVSVLSACSQLGALDRGRRIHAYIERNKVKVDSIVGTALIDMYSKCGCIERALSIFDALTSKDVFPWTAMIGGLALNGHGDRALQLFGKMKEEEVRPNSVTFVGVLCACSHGGWVELARHYFDLMKTIYGLEPQIEHYGCMVDALGRAGLLEEAVSLVQDMPGKANPVLWSTLLGACWIHGNAGIGKYIAERLTELEPDDGGVFVLLSNIYATAGWWNDARKARMIMKSKGLKKIPGCSSIEVGGAVHEFFVGDRSHPDSVEIYQKLEDISFRLKFAGYEPNTFHVLFDIEEEEKECVVAHHSEKLAIAYGLISTNDEETIRVVKNIRVCHDCHTVAKLISQIYNREIILRDRNVFHYFREGSCSCKGYW